MKTTRKVQKKAKIIILTIAFSLLFQVVALASTTWSAAGTFDIDHDSDWTYLTTSDTKLKDKKSTDSTNVSVYTISKTMASYPQFRMVNSNGEARSATFFVASAGNEKTDDSNTGENGHNYYAAVKPAWNQITDDQSVRIKFKSH